MNRIIPLAFCLLVHLAQAQYTISGTFSPAKDYSWLIAYRLKPGTQVYVADTAINDGKFELQMPDDSEQGSYRLVYAVPQEEFYFDLIYNGKEHIKLDFRLDTGPMFATSNENILFSTYFREIQEMEQRLIAFYSRGSADIDAFVKIVQDYKAIHLSYVNRSEGLMAQEFIQANRPYFPSKYEPLEAYVKNRKDHYFDSIDIANPILQASGFITDKITNYIFTALPLEQLSRSETEKAIIDNFKTVTELEGLEDTFRFHIYYTVWAQAAASRFNETSDFIYSKYLKSLADLTGNQEIKSKIEIHNRLRIGSRAPELSWKDGATNKTLSDLKGFENIILVFWSSTCSHCLNELPTLHDALKKDQNVKVVAIGLEDDEHNWKIESEKLRAFEHVMALGKWESNLAKLYDIHATPTYFVLDSDKRIITKPESGKEVVDFLED